MSAFNRAAAKSPWITVRLRRVSLRLDKRVPWAMLGLLLATLVVMVINMGVGEYPIAPLDVIRTILRLPTADPSFDFIVNTLRLPRMLVAALVGVALGISGAILQGLTRNPLADPGIIGVSAGASLAAVILIIGFGSAPGAFVSLGAFGGAVLMAALIYLLAWRGGDSPLRLILIGVGLASVAGAATTLLITFGRIDDAQQALIWLSGSVYGRSWDQFWPLFAWVVVLAPLSLLLARRLDALNLGEEIARSLGSRLEVDRGVLLLIAVALAGASVAAAGIVGFVGLISPHVARRLVGASNVGLLPVAGLLGGFLVVAADLVGRVIVAPLELPAGLVTAVVGAPFFLLLLWQRRHS